MSGFEDSRVLQSKPDVGNTNNLRLFAQQLAGFIDNPIADVRFTPEDVTASPRSVTVQVRDRLGEPWKARWWVLLMFGDAAFDTTATQTISFTGGAVAIEIKPDQVYLAMTDANGSIALTIAGSADDYFITASVVGRAQSSGAVPVT